MIDMKFTYRWYGDECMASVDRQMRHRARQAAEFIAGRIRSNIGRAGGPHNHSRPGEYPRRVSGTLQNSISARETRNGATIVVSAPYAKYVDANRPFMVRSFMENLETVRSIMTQRLSR